LKGDWEFFQQVLGFPAPNAVPNNCFKCKASPNVDHLLYTRAHAGIGWRGTERTHVIYLAELVRDGKEVPGLFAIRTLLHEGVMMDVLHAVDQGVASHLCADVVVECLDLYDGSTQAERVASLESYMNGYLARSERLRGKLIFARLRTSGDWPKLKAKASETRHFVKFALHLAAKHNSGSTHDKRRLAVCQLVQQFYDILDRNGVFISAADLNTLATLGLDFVEIWRKLSKEALDSRIRAWKLMPKFHLFVHI
jgi:hypothetical protein